MLTLNVSRIRSAHEVFACVYDPPGLGWEAEVFRVVAPADLALDIYKDQDRFRLSGRVKTTLEMPCSRCLDTFTFPVDAAFDLRYQPLTAGRGEREQEIGEDDVSAAYYEGDAIDLGELMREQCYLALPMKPLCREDCRGLCAQCGTNLNRATCGCRQDWEDPRLASLKSFKQTP